MSTQPYSSEFKDQVGREVQGTPNATLVARRHPLSPHIFACGKNHVLRESGNFPSQSETCSVDEAFAWFVGQVRREEYHRAEQFSSSAGRQSSGINVMGGVVTNKNAIGLENSI